jgi:two-component system cell cycle sensor histidine kinase/response regulator CckA
VGSGTAFRIYLPRHEPAAEPVPEIAPASAIPQSNAEIAASRLRGTRDLDKPGGAGPSAPRKPSPDHTGQGVILLVEDEDPVRAVNSRALSARGYTVLEAASGLDALALISDVDQPIDLVVSDVVMPEMDGPTLLRELRKHRPDLKVIFVSGYAEDAFRKNLPDGEDFNFLPKPFSLKQLVETVKETIAR